MEIYAGGGMRPCPFCGREIPAAAPRCDHCRTWLTAEQPVPQAAPQPGAYPAPLEFSFSQPPLHLALLSLCTIGGYEIYWFYRTWKQLKQQAGDQISPGWRTVGLFVPILNIYLVYKLFDRISDLRLQSGVGPMFAPGWLTAFYLIWCC